MKQGLLSATYSRSIVVEPKQCAFLDGELLHPVLSTYAIAYLAEVCARKALEPYFEQHEDAVGSMVQVHHHAMAVIGTTVQLTATVTLIHNNRVTCSVSAVAVKSGVRVATCLQEQVVLSRDRIQKLLEQA
jgi:fluoroacetyl-CoA thioesterase